MGIQQSRHLIRYEQKRFEATVLAAAEKNDARALDRLPLRRVGFWGVGQIHSNHCCFIGSREAARLGHLLIMNRLVSAIEHDNLVEICCKQCAELACDYRRLYIPPDELLAAVTHQGLRDQCCRLAAECQGRKGDLHCAARLLEAIADEEIRTLSCQSVADIVLCQNYLEDESSNSRLSGIANQQFRDQCRAKAAMRALAKKNLELASCFGIGVSDSALRDTVCQMLACSAVEKDRLDVVGPLLASIRSSALISQTCKKMAVAYFDRHDFDKDSSDLLELLQAAGLTEVGWVATIERLIRKLRFIPAVFLLQLIAESPVRDLLSQILFVSALRHGNISQISHHIRWRVEWAILDPMVLDFYAAEWHSLNDGTSDIIPELLRRSTVQQLNELLNCATAAGYSRLELFIASHLATALDVGDSSDCSAKVSVNDADVLLVFEL